MTKSKKQNPSKMKVFIDGQIFAVQDYGGVSKYFVEMLSILSSKNDIFVGLGIHRNKYLLEAKGRFKTGLVYVPKFPKGFGLIARLCNSLLDIIALIIIKPEIIHWTYFRKIHIGPRKCIKIITVYDMIHELFPQYFNNARTVTREKLKGIGCADHIITISQSTKNDLIELLGIDEEKISVIHLGVNEKIIRENIASYGGQRIVNDSQFILYVGARNGYKNFVKLIESLTLVFQNKPKLKLVCFGGGQFSNEEIEYFRAHELNDRIVHISGPDRLLHKLYSEASVFVYPSLYEGFGLPPIEAIAAGTKVCASNTSCIPEIMKDMCDYFDPLSAKNIANSINKTLEAPEICRSKVNQFLEYYTWTRCACEHENLYLKLLGRK